MINFTYNKYTALVFMFGFILLCISNYSYATKYLSINFETGTCGETIIDESFEGYFWDNVPSFPVATVSCAVITPNGTKYISWNVPNSTPSVDNEIYFTSHNIVAGNTYYLAAFIRFQRINGLDIWDDTGPAYQFDKLLEFRGNGFRWGIGAGWNGWYPNATDHKFTFDAWYSQVLYGNHGNDHIIANVLPYGSNNPLLLDYEAWNSVVIGVTAQNSESGRIEQWINGIKILDKAQYTMNSGATIDTIYINGTIGQPEYNTPAHYRQFDSILVTNNWQDIIDGGYLFTNNNTILLPPTNLRILY